MRIRTQAAAIVALVLAAVVASAQAPQSPPAKPPQPPATQPGPAKAPPPTQPAPAQPAPAQPAPGQPATAKPAPPAAAKAPPRRVTPSQVIVRDRSGSPLRDVRVAVSGTANQEVVTDAAGTASLGVLRDGSYRLRLERDGFITLERDITVRAAQPATVEVALSFSPPSAAPPPPSEPPTPPAPVVVTVPAPRLSSVPSGPPVFISLPDFLDKNYIGREPIKESVLACLADSTTRMLQLSESIGEHVHADMDEVLYIVAGEGTIRARGESSTVAAGALSVIPHGVPHAIARRGRNPLMVLSMLSGAPCPVGVPSDQGNR